MCVSAVYTVNTVLAPSRKAADTPIRFYNCGTSCDAASGQLCVNNVCQCPPAGGAPGGDTAFNSNANCGACGKACDTTSGFSCSNGTCACIAVRIFWKLSEVQCLSHPQHSQCVATTDALAVGRYRL